MKQNNRHIIKEQLIKCTHNKLVNEVESNETYTRNTEWCKKEHRI